MVWRLMNDEVEGMWKEAADVICMVELKKITKNINYDIWYPDQDSNRTTLQYAYKLETLAVEGEKEEREREGGR